MSIVEKIGLHALHRFDPETAHGLSIKALKLGLGGRGGPVSTPRLATSIAGLNLPNPVGLAAGFDKNAQCLAALGRSGFGFIEVGAATPRPQPGNPKPRLFRLDRDAAVINRFGFNNDGMHAIGNRLALRPERGIVGLNLGANKDSEDRAGDFAQVLRHCGADIDFATVNVSSPNTERLRDLQGKQALAALLEGVMATNADIGIPIFLKISPDLKDAELADVAEVATDAQLAGIIATNTTLDRDGLKSADASEAGGLSGQPVFEKSTRVLARLAGHTPLPLIGVGGVGSAEQAYTKIKAGACAIQLYSALVYSGLSLVGDIAQGLDTLLARDGFANVSEAIGIEREALAR